MECVLCSSTFVCLYTIWERSLWSLSPSPSSGGGSVGGASTTDSSRLCMGGGTGNIIGARGTRNAGIHH